MNDIKKYSGGEIALKNNNANSYLSLLNSGMCDIQFNELEKRVIAAYAKTHISDIDSINLLKRLEKITPEICMIVGCSAPSVEINVYIAEFLKLMYPSISLYDFRHAFTVLTTGLLDKYLKDKNHYKSFSIEYIGRVMSAYFIYRNEVIARVDKLHSENKEIPKKTSSNYNIDNNIARQFFYVKYKNQYPELTPINEMLMYNRLYKLGYAGELVINSDDKKKAHFKMRGKAIAGQISSFMIECLLTQGEDNDSVKDLSLIYCRSRVLKESILNIVGNELQIKKILGYEN